MRTEPHPHEDKAQFELARAVFEADNAAAKNPAYEWGQATPQKTAYAFNIAAGLIRRGYHRTPDDLVKVADVRPLIESLADLESNEIGRTAAKQWLDAHPEPKTTPGEADLVCSGGCGRFIPWPDATKESGWKITTTSGPDTKDAGSHLRAWCPTCGPFGGQYRG